MRQIVNRTGQAIANTLAIRTKRTGSGQIDALWKGAYIAPVATGGTITTAVIGGETYTIHTFTGSGTFTVTSVGSATSFNYLVQAGGGGASRYSGGGGGGGLVQSGEASAPTFTPTVRSYTITIGAGGTISGNDAFGGQNSSIQDVQTCTGGGQSRTDTAGGTGVAGGCGGGGRYNYPTGGAGTAGPPRQGYDGGFGGGGTAAAAGFGNNNGGAGRSTTIRGSTEYFGGGGGGSGYATGVSGTAGGVGGGGSSAAGGTNTGGGGGGDTGYLVAYGGGSGIVIIAYRTA